MGESVDWKKWAEKGAELTNQEVEAAAPLKRNSPFEALLLLSGDRRDREKGVALRHRDRPASSTCEERMRSILISSRRYGEDTIYLEYTARS